LAVCNTQENIFLDIYIYIYEKNHKINTRKKNHKHFFRQRKRWPHWFWFLFLFLSSADAFSGDDKDDGDEGMLCWWSCRPCLCVFLAFDCVVPYGFLCPVSLLFLLPLFLSSFLFSFFFLSSFGVFFFALSLSSFFPFFSSPSRGGLYSLKRSFV